MFLKLIILGTGLDIANHKDSKLAEKLTSDFFSLINKLWYVWKLKIE